MFSSIAADLMHLRAFLLSQCFSWSGFLQKSMMGETFFFLFLMGECNCEIFLKERSFFIMGWLHGGLFYFLIEYR